MRIRISAQMANWLIKNFKDHYAINVIPLKLWDNMESLLLKDGSRIVKVEKRYYLLTY